MSKNIVLTTFTTIALVSFSTMTYSEQATPKHGYVSNPPSRSFLCSEKGEKLNKHCGAIQYEPQ